MADIKTDPKVAKSLAMLALELQACNRLKPDAAKVLIPIFEKDLSDVAPDIAVEAIARHRDDSPWWPAWADLRNHIGVIQAERAKAQAPAYIPAPVAKLTEAERDRRVRFVKDTVKLMGGIHEY